MVLMIHRSCSRDTCSINDEASRLQQIENADIGITPQFEGARKRHVEAATAANVQTDPNASTAHTYSHSAMQQHQQQQQQPHQEPLIGLAALEAAAQAHSQPIYVTEGGSERMSKRQRA